MYHRVRPVGPRQRGMLAGMTLDTRLDRAAGDRWIVAEGGRTRAELDYDELRISISWKAQVFRSEKERELYDGHGDDLSIEVVFDRFSDDLRRRGVAFRLPEDPLRDDGFVALLARTYVREPSVFD
jgi:hypothetical protein